MFNSETLEVAIGMAFMFLSVSLVCTAMREWLEGILKWRAMDLERGLRTLLADTDGSLTSQLLRHPVLDSLFAGHYDPAQLRRSWFTPGTNSLHMRLTKRRNLPSYIPATQFAIAFLDMVARGPMPGTAGMAPGGDVDAALSTIHPGPLSVAALRQSALGLGSPQLQRVLLSALDHSKDDLAQARLNIERWFNGTMDRTSGWYKRRTQTVLFLLGLALAAIMNIDAFHIMQRLMTDKAFREVVVNQAAVAPGPDSPGVHGPARTHRHGQTRAGTSFHAIRLAALGVPDRLAGPARTPAVVRSLGQPVVPAAAMAGRRLAGGAGRMAGVGLRGHARGAVLVRRPQPVHGDPLHRQPHEKSPEEASQDHQSDIPTKPDSSASP